MGPLKKVMGPLKKVMGPLKKVMGPLKKVMGPLKKVMGPFFVSHDNIFFVMILCVSGFGIQVLSQYLIHL